MNIPEPQLLQVLIVFQESKNLVQTAERLRISQPAVTQRLQRLQEQVTQPLYAYDGRKKVLTHFGKALYELAKSNFLHLETAYENLNRRYLTPDQLVLKIGGQKELVILFSELIDFCGLTDHRKMSDEQAIVAVESDIIDIALSESIIDSNDLISRKFFESSSRIIFHRKYFPAAVNFSDIQEQKTLLIKNPCAVHRLETLYIEKFCKGLKINSGDLNERALFEDWYSILNFIESTGGYAIVPGFVQSSHKDIKAFDIPHSMINKSNYYAVFQKKLKKIESFKKTLNFSMSSS